MKRRNNLFIFKPGGYALGASFIFLGLMMICAFTPFVWILSGSPDESYPELLFVAVGIPLGLLLVVIAATRYWWKNRNINKSAQEGLK